MIVKDIPEVAVLELEPEHKILTITFREINLDLDAAIKLSDATNALFEENKIDKVGVISDMRSLLHVSRTAREYFAEEENAEAIIADAIVLTSPLLRELYNLSMKFTKPKYPVKAFSSLLEARKWVEDMVKQQGQ